MSFTSTLALFHFYLIVALIPAASAAAQNFVVPWSKTKFGPDGPWQAINITAGGNDSTKFLYAQPTATVSLYPGGEWQSMTFKQSSCEDYPNTQCGLGGFWEPDEEQASQYRVSWPATWVDNSSFVNVKTARTIILGMTINQKTVWNASLASATDGKVTYPNGFVGGVTLGSLSLGAEDSHQFFTTSNTDNTKGFTASQFSGGLFEQGEIPSYSYGLHIGSAAFDYPGSLVFGGYNKGRVIAPVTSFADQNAIDLIDIGIGTEDGDSPFNFTTKDKLLAGGQVKVKPNPLSPYLSFPRKTCENLAAVLPISFDSSTRYYLWNTEDPDYKKIVSSPAYLSFTFPPAPGASDNVVIKVPFALLNLTLEYPISDSPKQYFPCAPHEGGPVLGRAFLQAAFVGRNWRTKTSWLAQAPGPGVARDGLRDQNIDIADNATVIEGFSGGNLFNETWKNYWSVTRAGVKLPPADPSNTNLTSGSGGQAGNGTTNGAISSSKSGISTGAKAGIGAGVGILAIAAIGVLFLVLRRRRAKRAKVDTTTPEMYAPGAEVDGYHTPYTHPPTEKWARNDDHDQNTWVRSPNPSGNGTISEMPARAESPVEVADTSVPNWPTKARSPH